MVGHDAGGQPTLAAGERFLELILPGRHGNLGNDGVTENLPTIRIHYYCVGVYYFIMSDQK